MAIEIRPGVIEDAAVVAGLNQELFPYRAKSEEQFRQDLRRAVEDPARAIFAAESDGLLTGWAATGPSSWRNIPGAFHLGLFVHTGHRGQGIGSRLLAAVDAHLADQSAIEVEALPNEDGLPFAVNRGYQAFSEMRFAGVDLRELPPEPEQPQGIELVPLFELDADAVFAAYRETGQDIPETPVTATPEWFRQAVWESPSVAREFSFAAVDGDRVVCYTVNLSSGAALWTDMTGTVRSHRGRGLARVVKWAALRAAADAGLTLAYTANNEENRPMLAINEWFGYRVVGRHTVVRRKLRVR
jgi:GNAT superfamily N-acetyltransferase